MGEVRDPLEQVILVSSFDPVLHEANILPKSTPPFVETGPLISEHFGISDDPNMPASNEYHFREERPIKISPCLSNQLNHGGASRPINL